jgi:hypothetical protein
MQQHGLIKTYFFGHLQHRNKRWKDRCHPSNIPKWPYKPFIHQIKLVIAESNHQCVYISNEDEKKYAFTTSLQGTEESLLPPEKMSFFESARGKRAR